MKDYNDYDHQNEEHPHEDASHNHEDHEDPNDDDEEDYFADYDDHDGYRRAQSSNKPDYSYATYEPTSDRQSFREYYPYSLDSSSTSNVKTYQKPDQPKQPTTIPVVVPKTTTSQPHQVKQANHEPPKQIQQQKPIPVKAQEQENRRR